MRRGVPVLLAALLLLGLPAGAAARPIATAVTLDVAEAIDGTTLPAMKALGVSHLHLYHSWRSVARTRPLQAASPLDPAYDWAGLDAALIAIRAQGLEPVLALTGAPPWAERAAGGSAGTNDPDPAAYGEFARALGARYSGALPGLPRVAWFSAWNEPNTHLFLGPQRSGRRDVSPGKWLTLHNAFADGIHLTAPGARVIAGELFPFSADDGRRQAVAPLTFLRKALCSGPRGSGRTCDATLRADAVSIHPYTVGGPRHGASSKGSVSMGDLPSFRREVRGLEAAGAIVASSPVELQVGEFSWDTRPPDPRGVPEALHGRWVAEALFRMWHARYSLATWFTLRDGPPTSLFQSGLFHGMKAKPAARAWRFPFVVTGKGVRRRFWARTPGAVAARVTVEQRRRGRWIRVKRMTADADGIAEGEVRLRGQGSLRARTAKDRSLSFPTDLPPDRSGTTPFGSVPANL